MRLGLVLVVVAVTAVAASSAPDQDRELVAAATVIGELVDVQCHSKDAKNVGVEHADCALSCARRGATLGILASDGLYVITGEYTRESNRRLISLVAKEVEAAGTVSEKDGRRLLAVNAISERK